MKYRLTIEFNTVKMDKDDKTAICERIKALFVANYWTYQNVEVLKCRIEAVKEVKT